MQLIHRRWAGAGAFVVLIGSAHAADAPLRIKNGYKMTVRLGKTREAAVGIRPEKMVWTLELTRDLVGATANLEDVTPRWASAPWSVPTETERLVLDAERVLP